MASGKGNLILAGISGSLGKEWLVKQYKGGRIVFTRYPEKIKRPYTKLRALREGWFAAAVKYAQAINSNQELKKAYEAKVKPGQRVYNYAISEYMELARTGKIPPKMPGK